MIDVEKLKKLHEAATKGDLSTAERYTEHEHIECPVCQGDGEVLASDYCNIDGKALGVQFYGIGNEFGAHEALWSYLVHSVPAILAMAEERQADHAEINLKADFIDKTLNQLAASDERIAQLEAENRRLREALTDLASWFDGGPSSYGPWIIKAGEYGADDAVNAARAALNPTASTEEEGV